MKVISIAAASAVLALGVVAGGSAATAEPAAPSQAKGNVVQTAVGAGQFKTLASLLKRAGLARTLQGKGPFTVFAPTDAAFAKVPKSTLAALGKDRAALRSVLLYHVAAGRVPAARVVKLKAVETLNGQSVRIRVAKGSVFVGGAKVITPDVKATNGVIHVINKVLIPPAAR